MSTIVERVTKLVCEQLGVKENEVTLEASFVEDLGADSLDTVELVMAWKKSSRQRFLMKKPRKSQPLRKRSTISKPIPKSPTWHAVGRANAASAALIFPCIKITALTR